LTNCPELWHVHAQQLLSCVNSVVVVVVHPECSENKKA
jgi:hypothetical protein